jgi:hypothetical protein
MIIDIPLQHLVVTFILVTIFLIGDKYGDGSTKWGFLFFVGGISLILLIVYWIYYILISLI